MNTNNYLGAGAPWFGRRPLIRAGVHQLAAFVVTMVATVQSLSAATIGFTGDFSPVNWSLTGPEVLAFPDSQTMTWTGPSTMSPANPTLSELDFNGPGGNGVSVSGVLTFHYTFYTGDATAASVTMGTSSGQGGFNPPTLQGGPGATFTGSVTIHLTAGDVFAFLFSANMPAKKKTPARFTVDGLQYEPDQVPEVATACLCLVPLALLVGHEALRRRRSGRVVVGVGPLPPPKTP